MKKILGPKDKQEALNQKSPIYPLHLGGVWMVGVRGHTGPKKL
jgi:hypothetical protein